MHSGLDGARRSLVRFPAARQPGAGREVAGADEPPTDAVRKDRKAIEGTWKVVVLVDDGKQSKPEEASKVFVVNGDDGTWSLHADGKVRVTGRK